MFKNLLKLAFLITLLTACTKKQDQGDPSLKVDQPTEVLSSPIEYTDMGVPYYNDASTGKRVELHGEFRVERDNKPELILNTPSLNFGSLVGDQYSTSKVTVKNVGIKQAEEIKVVASPNFQIINNNCDNLTLKTDEVCFFRVYFNAKNKNHLSFLEEIIVSDKETKVSLPVSAKKVLDYDFTLESSTKNLSFDSKKTVSTRNVRIINRGPGVADQIKASLTSSEFTMYQNDCEGSSLSTNQYCTISLQFESSKHEAKNFSSYLLVSSTRNNKEVQVQLQVNNEKTYLVAEDKLENVKDEENDKSQNPNDNNDVALQLKKMQEDLIKESKLSKEQKAASLSAQAKAEEDKKLSEEKAKKEAEALAKKQEEEAAKLAKLEEKRRLEAEIKIKEQQLAAEQAAALVKKQAEELAKQKEQADKLKQDLLAKKQLEEKLKAEQLAKAQAKAAAEAKLQEEIKAKQEASALAKKQADEEILLAKLAAEEKLKQESLAKKEQEEKLRQEQLSKDQAKAEAEAKIKAEIKAKKEAEILAKKQAEETARLAKLEEKRKTEEEKLAKKRAEDEIQAKLKLQKEEQIKQKLAEEVAIKKALEDKQAKIAAEAKAKVEEKNKMESELAAKIFTEKLKINKALAEEKTAKEESLKKAQEEKVRAEKEALAKKEAEEKAIIEAEQLAKEQEEDRIERERLAKLSEQQRLNEEISRQQSLLLEQQALAEEKKKLEQERLDLEKEKAQAKIAADNYRIQSELKAQQVIEEERIKQEQQMSQQFAYEKQQLAKAQAKAQAELRTQIIQATTTTPVRSRPVEQVVATTKEQLSSPVTSQSANVELEESENGDIEVLTGEGTGNFTPMISLKGSSVVSEGGKIQMSYNKTMNPHVLRYDKVLTTYKQDMPLFAKPVAMVEGKVLDQKSLMQILEGKSLASENVTDLERNIELDLKGGTSADTCSFSGVFSYIKCVFSSMKLAVKDLINLDKLESIKIYANGNVSNEINLQRISVSQVHPTLVPSSLTQKNQALFQNEMYFQAKIAENKSKLFKIDYFSISQVSNSNPAGDDSPLRLVVFKGELYYSSLNYLGLSKLFKSDGKKIVQISNIFPEGNDYLVPAIVYNDDLYLEGVNERGFLKLYKTDGKEIVQVSDINPSGSDAPSDFKVYNGELYFRANNMLGQSKLFKISPIGISQVSDINPASHDAPEFLEIYHGELYFSAFKEGEGNKLFKFNGDKISQVSNTNIQNDEPSDLKTYQDKLYFVANNKDGRRKLFRLDNEKIEEFSNIRSEMSDFAQNFREKKSFLTEYNKELYFVAKNENNAFKIFKTDGKSLSQVSNINDPDPAINPSGSDFPFNLMVYNDHLYFSAYGNKVGLKLYRLKSESTEK